MLHTTKDKVDPEIEAAIVEKKEILTEHTEELKKVFSASIV